MKAATPEQIDTACLTRSADDAWRHLLSMGLMVSKSHCDVTIARLIAENRRGKMRTGAIGETNTSIERIDAIMGSRRLLEATVKAFKNRAARDHCSLEMAMAKCLYAPAAVASWKAAA